MKKLFSIVLTLILILSICGCASGGGSGKNNAKLVDNTYVSDFPIVKEKETLNVMAVQLANHGDFDQMSFTTEYEKMTNIDIKWKLVPAADINSSVALSLASGNLSDVLCILDNRIGNSTFLKYTADGTLIKLNELIDTYGDNIKKMFNSYPHVKTDTVAADGNIYSLPLVNVMTENHLRFPYKLYIRKTWLDNLNLQVPSTTEDFYNVLSAFRDNDPNGNGQNDEVPFAMAGLNDAFFGSFGVSYFANSGYLSVNDNGEVEYALATNGAKKGLSYLNRLYTQELALLYDSDSKWQSKIRSGVVGAFYGIDKYTVAGDTVGAEYQMIAPLNANDGSKPTLSVNNSVTPNGFMITKVCKNPAAALRWIDYMYSPKGAVLANYGGEGDKVTLNKDGKYESVEKNLDKDRYNYAPGHAIPYLLDDAYDSLFVKKPENEKTLQDKHNDELISDVKNILVGKFEPAKEIGVLMIDKEAADVEDQYLKTVREYAIEMINKFAKGEENIETGWNAYLTEINKKGLSEIIKQYQRLYNLKNKD